MAKYRAPPDVTKQTAEFLKKVASLNLPPTLLHNGVEILRHIV